MVLQSLFLQNFLGYPTFEAGLYMAPRGVASLLVMMFVGKFSGRIPLRNFIFVGILASIMGNYLMTRFTSDITANDLIVPMMLQGMGMGLIFVPISTLAFTTLPKETARRSCGHLQPDPRTRFRARHLDTGHLFLARHAAELESAARPDHAV